MTSPGAGPLCEGTADGDAGGAGRGSAESVKTALGHWAEPAPGAAAPGAGSASGESGRSSGEGGASGGLPGPLLQKLSRAFGTDFSDVRVVADDPQVAALGAHAYARGNQLRFAPGKYDPGSLAGQHLIAHELTHVVQQRAGRVAAPQAYGAGVVQDQALEAEAESTAHAVMAGHDAHGLAGRGGRSAGLGEALPIQRFESPEHQSLGNEATGFASYNLGGKDPFSLTHGDITALAGDFFAPDASQPDGLFHLASVPGAQGQRIGSRDEVLWALHEANPHDSRFAASGVYGKWQFSEAVKQAVLARYQRLAAKNTGHFAAPRGRGPDGKPLPTAPGEQSAGGSYRSLHEAALRAAFTAGRDKTPLDMPLAMEAAADHFLTDAFSAGHLRTPIGSIRDYWKQRYPLFFYNLLHKIALDTATKMNSQETNIVSIIGSVNMMYNTIMKKIHEMQSTLPEIGLGDLLGKVFHDYDNEVGVPAAGGGKLFGDNHLDQPDSQNVTRSSAVRAVQSGVAEVKHAYALGQQSSDLSDAAMLQAVRQHAKAPGEQYAAEALLPKPDPSAPGQNWQAGSIEELWQRPVVGSSGPTVGNRVTEALQPGGEMHTQLLGLAQSFPEVDTMLHPRQAYLNGFLKPLVSNPYSGLLGIIHWSPSYGLAGNSKDDVALQTGQELDSGHAAGGHSKLEGMTFPARTQYIRELMSGYCAGDEQDLIIRLFETVPAGERRALYQAVEGHAWTGDFKEGVFTRDDDLVDSLSRARLNRLRDVINAP